MSATTRKSSVTDTSVNKNDISSSSKSNGMTLDRRDSDSDEDKRALKISEKDRKIGHRRINEEGEVSYKKIHSNQLVASIQLGIQYSVGVMTKYDERDLLMQDFMTVETNVFPKNGGHHTPAHTFSDFKFSTFAPLAFRYFLNLFGVKRDDFMMSICNDSLRELSNPGASGSLFFLTNDDEFILKTVMHKEAEFLQKLLPGYYMNLNQNPHTLLPKFFGMFVYQCNQKNIRLTVMNNLLPSDVKMHLKFDLKGSTYKRKASKRERAKSSPTFKDLDFMELLPEGLLLEAETYNALISTLRRDSRVLESFRIMDYSLLVGVHNLDLAAKEEDASGAPSPTRAAAKQRALQKAKLQKQKLVSHSTAMESIQAQTEPIDEQEHLPPGGIPARNHKGERLLLYLGIIDILQSYRIRKKLEHTFKAIIHDGDTVSVHRPNFYAHRFLDFMADKVFKKIPSPLKHSPSKKGKKDSAIRRISNIKTTNVGAPTSLSNDNPANSSSNNDELDTVTEKTSKLSFTPAATKPESVVPSSQNGDYHFSSLGMTSSQRPDVVPGNAIDAAANRFQKPMPSSMKYSEFDDENSGISTLNQASYKSASTVSSSQQYSRYNSTMSSSYQETNKVVSRGITEHSSYLSGAIDSSASPNLSRKNKTPKNRQTSVIKNQSIDSIGSDYSSISNRGTGSTGGTPSRLSVGRGAGSGWNTPTPANTWNTEGTPSYTASSLSGAASLGESGPSAGVGQSSLDDVCDDTIPIEQ